MSGSYQPYRWATPSREDNIAVKSFLSRVERELEKQVSRALGVRDDSVMPTIDESMPEEKEQMDWYSDESDETFFRDRESNLYNKITNIRNSIYACEEEGLEVPESWKKELEQLEAKYDCRGEKVVE